MASDGDDLHAVVFGVFAVQERARIRPIGAHDVARGRHPEAVTPVSQCPGSWPSRSASASDRFGGEERGHR
jgi:hypothetical protein